jgi:hypothetical protein
LFRFAIVLELVDKHADIVEELDALASVEVGWFEEPNITLDIFLFDLAEVIDEVFQLHLEAVRVQVYQIGGRNKIVDVLLDFLEGDRFNATLQCTLRLRKRRVLVLNSGWNSRWLMLILR